MYVYICYNINVDLQCHLWLPPIAQYRANLENVNMAKYIDDRSCDSLFVDGSLDNLLPENSIARIIFDVVCTLDFCMFDAKYCNDENGRPAIDPRRLASLWILAMLRGVTSSVKLAGLCLTDIEMRWTCGDAHVKKSTLCDFRKTHIEELTDLSTQVLAAMARCEMLPGNQMATDGSIIRAAASCDASCKRKHLKKKLDKLNEVIKDKLSQPEADEIEVCEQTKRKERIEQALEQMTLLGLDDEDARMTITEADASMKKMKTGQFAPAHNVQSTVDLESGAIIKIDLIEQANDQGQLADQLNNAKDKLEQVNEKLADEQVQVGPIKTISADGAYHDTRQIVDLENEGIEVFVPDGQPNRKPPGVSDDFLLLQFEYDGETDTMTCPQAKQMKRHSMNGAKTSVKYRAKTSDCNACPFKNQCCPKAKQGRTVSRQLFKAELKIVADRVASERGQKHKKARSVVAEGAFGRIVELLNWRRCRTWGKDGAKAEGLWRQITHNLMLLTGQWKPLVIQEIGAV